MLDNLDGLDSHSFRFESNDMPSLLGFCAAEDDALLVAGIIEGLKLCKKSSSRFGTSTVDRERVSFDELRGQHGLHNFCISQREVSVPSVLQGDRVEFTEFAEDDNGVPLHLKDVGHHFDDVMGGAMGRCQWQRKVAKNAPSFQVHKSVTRHNN